MSSDPYAAADLFLRGVMTLRAQEWSEWPLAVQYENKNLIDLTTVEQPFVTQDLVFFGGGQADLNPQSKNVAYGQILLAACVKEDSGSVLARRLINFLRPAFEKQDFSGLPEGVQLSSFAAFPSRARPFQGWECYPLIVPVQLHYL